MRDMPTRGSRTATNKAKREMPFKTCATCKTPAKCKAAGMCLAKAKAKK